MRGTTVHEGKRLFHTDGRSHKETERETCHEKSGHTAND